MSREKKMVNGGRFRMSNRSLSSEKPSILTGVNELIDNALDLNSIGKAPHHKHKKSCLKLASKSMQKFDPAALIEMIYEKIKSNWHSSSYHKGSEENWRFIKNTYVSDDNSSPEVCLERAIVNIPQELWPDAADWVNQVPTASGLVDPNADGSRRIDLVHKCGDKEYEFIELKVGSDTPLYAAMEILKYGVLYIFSREHEEASKYVKKEQDLLKATKIHLKVLAPASYYAPYNLSCNLSWLEARINSGFASFLTKFNFKMDFKFETLALTLTRSSPWVTGGPQRTLP
jgi:hypothetical protein